MIVGCPLCGEKLEGSGRDNTYRAIRDHLLDHGYDKRSADLRASELMEGCVPSKKGPTRK